jgi:F-box and leucine-rich repeat protein GRR1
MEMDLAQVPQLTDTTVYGIFLNARHVREIKLNGHEFITNAAIPNLPNLWQMSEAELESYSQKYADIVADSLELVSEPADGGETGFYSPRMKSGRSLVVRTVDPAFLRPVTDVFEHLRLVDLTGCARLGDRAIENLVANAPKLRSLTLTKCANLTDAALESIGRLGKHLHYLHLGHVAT